MRQNIGLYMVNTEQFADFCIPLHFEMAEKAENARPHSWNLATVLPLLVAEYLLAVMYSSYSIFSIKYSLNAVINICLFFIPY